MFIRHCLCHYNQINNLEQYYVMFHVLNLQCKIIIKNLNIIVINRIIIRIAGSYFDLITSQKPMGECAAFALISKRALTFVSSHIRPLKRRSSLEGFIKTLSEERVTEVLQLVCCVKNLFSCFQNMWTAVNVVYYLRLSKV